MIDCASDMERLRRDDDSHTVRIMFTLVFTLCMSIQNYGFLLSFVRISNVLVGNKKYVNVNMTKKQEHLN